MVELAIVGQLFGNFRTAVELAGIAVGNCWERVASNFSGIVGQLDSLCERRRYKTSAKVGLASAKFGTKSTESGSSLADLGANSGRLAPPRGAARDSPGPFAEQCGVEPAKSMSKLVLGDTVRGHTGQLGFWGGPGQCRETMLALLETVVCHLSDMYFVVSFEG